MRLNTTTDLTAIRQGKPFTWGTVKRIYDLTDYYTLVEFTPREGQDLPTKFHIYVDEKDTCRSSLSIEGALLIMIAYAGFANKNQADERSRAAALLLEIEEV